MPAETQDSKRMKLESSNEVSNTSTVQNNPANLPMINPFMASNAAGSMDPNAPNLQLTHLMALFQLQNPLFYQNLYPGGMAAANMVNILGDAAVNGANANSGTNVKQEFNDKSESKE